MAAFVPKRQIDSNSANKEVKRIAAFVNAKTAAMPAAIATPNATDLATAITLANANKVAINAILAALA